MAWTSALPTSCGVATQGAEMNQLLTRLRNGETWLRDTNEQLLAMEHVGRGTELESSFLDAIELYCQLEMLLRSVYPTYEGCVLGEGQMCEATATVRCRHCAGLV